VRGKKLYALACRRLPGQRGLRENPGLWYYEERTGAVAIFWTLRAANKEADRINKEGQDFLTVVPIWAEPVSIDR
jgi:hypothetical protein